MKNTLQKILSNADITIDGNNPWDIQVHNNNLYKRVLTGGSLALGESYMDEWWSCEALDVFFYKILKASLDSKLIPLSCKLSILKSKILNMQSRSKSMEVIEEQYQIGNDLFMSFLDPYNQYTCGYFQDTDDLNTAQEKKLDLICRKLMLTPDDKVLDIGCGWGGFAQFAAEKYQCHVTGITLSENQLEHAQKKSKNLPVTIKKQDYRDLVGEQKYDKILVCGMIEHVGYKNYANLMRIVHKNLKNDGLFLLHTIGRNTSVSRIDPWTNKYIFKNAMIPSSKQLAEASERLFVLEDWHNFGRDYDKTLMAWQQNFTKNWDKMKTRYSERFFRMWNYYLLSCAGTFRSNETQLWQIVFSKKERETAYRSFR